MCRLKSIPQTAGPPIFSTSAGQGLPPLDENIRNSDVTLRLAGSSSVLRWSGELPDLLMARSVQLAGEEAGEGGHPPGAQGGDVQLSGRSPLGIFTTSTVSVATTLVTEPPVLPTTTE